MRITSFIIIISLFITSCTQRMICPAYQSAFIHDEDVQFAKFSYFRPDSTPKIRETDKNKFLIVDAVPYKKRIREMKTVEMRDIIPVPEDSVTFDQDLMLAERDVVDSTQLSADASEELHPGLKGPFNVDQELYLYYLEDILLYPDARAAQKEEVQQSNMSKREIRREKRRQRKEERQKEKEEKEKKDPFSIFNKKEAPQEEEQPQQQEPENEEEQPAEDDGNT